MKIIFSLLMFAVLISCSGTKAERREKVDQWNSGAASRQSFQEQRQEERDEKVRNQMMLPGKASTNQSAF